jgi:hypothetical protein
LVCSYLKRLALGAIHVKTNELTGTKKQTVRGQVRMILCSGK